MVVEELPNTEGLMKAEGKKPIVVRVDDAHPFDLEQYIAAYSGA